MRTHQSDVEDVIRNITTMLMENEAVDSAYISSTESFDVMGLDSLTLIELSIKIEAFYKTSISGGEIASLQNLTSVSEEVVRRVRASHAA